MVLISSRIWPIVSAVGLSFVVSVLLCGLFNAEAQEVTESVEFQETTILTPSKTNSLILEIRRDLPYLDWTNLYAACEARAHEVAKYFEGKGIVVAKIFIEGEEALAHRKWSFHSAVAVKVEIQPSRFEWRVIDPSFSHRPLTTNEWITEIVGDQREHPFQVYIKNRFTFRPTSQVHPEKGDFLERSDWNLGELQKACWANWIVALSAKALKSGDRLELNLAMSGRIEQNPRPPWCPPLL